MFQLFKLRSGSDRYKNLPTVPAGASEVTKQFSVAAGGLALILSRSSEIAIAKQFKRTRTLYELIIAELTKWGKTSASAELINDVMHEVAEYADPRTMAALRECLRERAEYDRRKSIERGGLQTREQAAATQRASPFHSSGAGPRSEAQSSGLASEIQTSQLDPVSKRLRTAIDEARRRRTAQG